MPSLIDLRRRIRAVKNTQQITKAMKMVAASKLRRAQERIMNARPYAVQMQRVLASAASRVDPSAHPLLRGSDVVKTAESYTASGIPVLGKASRADTGRMLLVIVTADKGLCGSFNTNIIKAAAGQITRPQVYDVNTLSMLNREVVLGLVGRKGRDFFGRRGFSALFEQVGLFQKLRYDDAQAIARTAIDAFVSEQVHRVVLVYNEFKSVISQRIVVDQLLPIARADVEAGAGATDAERGEGVPGVGNVRGEGVAEGVDYLYEPSPQEVFNQLLPRHVEVQIYRALLESNAAFFAAQMTAMDTATKNSADMLSSLTLYMNKVRQAAITREIIEVVSGAQAL